jgi:hypothetical protein
MNTTSLNTDKLEQRTRECGREQKHKPAIADCKAGHALPRIERP